MENKSNEELREVGVLQTLLLTMIYAAYSGDSNLFERGLALQSVLGNVSSTVPQPLILAPAKSSRNDKT